VCRLSGKPGRIGRIGAVRSNAWIWLFSSIESTTALSGGFKYNPTTSRILVSNWGSVENLNVSRRHGCSPHLRQILLTHTCEMPSWSASSRLDQCVTPSFSDGGSSVASTTATSSTCAGRPGLGRSANPSSPPSRYRFFQPITVGLDTPTRATISLVPTPSAASSTIRARCAKPARNDDARIQRVNSARSSAGTSTGTVNDIPHDIAR
jgi:hypothetical protein